jgi:hypothetical protein
MMIDLFLIGGFGISLFFGFASIPHLRIHFRTGMKGSLLMGIGCLLLALAALGITILETGLAPLHEGDSLYDPIFSFFVVVLVLGFLTGQLGFIILNTRESGLWFEILEKTTFKQKLTGNIPILKYEKPPPPAMSRRTGLVLGISAVIFGLFLITLNIIFKHQPFYIEFYISAAVVIVIGLMIVIFSIIYLDKSKKSPKKNK